MGDTFPLSGEAWMPWKECSVMDERLRFVARLLDGEAMSAVCRAFGISRKTGYKIFDHIWQQSGADKKGKGRRGARFAPDSPLEEEGFELPVPLRRGAFPNRLLPPLRAAKPCRDRCTQPERDRWFESLFLHQRVQCRRCRNTKL